MRIIHEGWGKTCAVLNSTASGELLPLNDRPDPSTGRWQSRRRKLGASLLGVLFLLIGLILHPDGGTLRAGETDPSEAQVKAAFLLNFPKYVDWPAEAFPETNSPIVIAIYGDDEVANEFSTMSAGRVIGGHPVQLVRLTSLEPFSNCHILFVGGGQSRKLSEALEKFHGLNVLTVGESVGFLEQGGMINLVRRDRLISLEVNLDSLRGSGLKVSSRLLSLATVKGGGK
jgi:hypothetical protein